MTEIRYSVSLKRMESTYENYIQKLEDYLHTLHLENPNVVHMDTAAYCAAYQFVPHLTEDEAKAYTPTDYAHLLGEIKEEHLALMYLNALEVSFTHDATLLKPTAPIIERLTTRYAAYIESVHLQKPVPPGIHGLRVQESNANAIKACHYYNLQFSENTDWVTSLPARILPFDEIYPKSF